jgi:DNA-binding protein HU-beta
MEGEIVMNKAELVNAIAEKTGLSKKDTEATINSFFSVVSDELAKK